MRTDVFEGAVLAGSGALREAYGSKAISRHVDCAKAESDRSPLGNGRGHCYFDIDQQAIEAAGVASSTGGAAVMVKSGVPDPVTVAR